MSSLAHRYGRHPVNRRLRRPLDWVVERSIFAEALAKVEPPQGPQARSGVAGVAVEPAALRMALVTIRCHNSCMVTTTMKMVVTARMRAPRLWVAAGAGAAAGA